jgi:hypothetical protein
VTAWVKCADSLPPTGTGCIVSDGKRVEWAYRRDLRFHKKPERANPWMGWSGQLVFSPTHWMPMPSAPDEATAAL